MKNYDGLLLRVLRDAQRPGRILPPAALLNAVQLKEKPVRAISDIDMCNALFKAFEDEYSFIKVVKVTGRIQRSQDYKNLVALVRWVIKELKTWRIKKDRKYHTLTAIFIVTHSCDLHGVFWRSFPAIFVKNIDLIMALQKVIGSVEVKMSKFPHKILETDTVNRFNLADTQGDFVKIAENWRILEEAIFPNVFQIQAVRLLYRSSLRHLVFATKSIRQTVVAMEVALALSIEQRLFLAIASDNPYIHFSCAYTTLIGRGRQIQLSPIQQKLLTKLFVKISRDRVRWKAWMIVFNHFPVRYPVLQVALGHALAVVPIYAVEDYVDSMALTITPLKDRGCASECLKAFRKKATLNRRKKLWTIAFKRWAEWRFGKRDNTTFLSEISCSSLDYAIVGYSIECLNKAERNQALIEITESLNFLEQRWFSSVSNCITEYNRLLSMFQPYAHALSVVGKDWLVEAMSYQPFKEPYLSMKFGV